MQNGPLARQLLRRSISHLLRGLPPGTRGRVRVGSGLDRLLGWTGYTAWQETVRCRDGVRMYLDTDEPQQRQIYWTGVYDRPSIEALAEALPDGGVLVDIGAGVGSICLFVAKACANLGKSVKVHAIEPMGLNYERLLRNVGLNLLAEDVSCHRLALGAEKGSLDLCYAGGAGSAAVVRTGPDIDSLAGERRESVQVDTLDDWVAATGLVRLDAIKADIEGAEPLMFRGAMTTIQRFNPVILAEFNHWWADRHSLSITADCFDPLRDLGYRTYRRGARRGRWERVHGRPPPGPGMEDTLWMPPGREPGGS